MDGSTNPTFVLIIYLFPCFFNVHKPMHDVGTEYQRWYLQYYTGKYK